MPPNADSSFLRQRFAEKEVQSSSQASSIPDKSIHDLKGTEVAIDGVVYDLNHFDHPGGDSILLFGGNDVTVQYRMIHPNHTKKHLEKLRTVGRVLDWKPEYTFDTEFEREIKREVFKIVRRGREFGTPGFFIRVIFYVCLMTYLQYLWATQGASWGLALMFGISQAFIGLNVQHDANHGAASRKPWINDLLGFGADFIGGQKWNWMQQHWTHHAYTNHNRKDPDSFSAEPLMLFNDYPLGNNQRKYYHKFQALFFLPVLSFYWLSMVFNPQTFTLQHAGAYNMGMKMTNDFTKKRRKYAVALRILYIYLNIARPLYLAGWNKSGVTCVQILLMGCAESLMLATLFSLSHNFEMSDRDPTKTYRETGKPVCWFKAQVETSSTYGGFIAGALTGGLNFQIEHHLFPRMCSAYYPYIAPTVRAVCEKHGVRYVYYPWVGKNFISTIKYMHKAGSGENWMTPMDGKM